MKFLTTSELMNKLGVSRQWVNQHLRDMGQVIIKDNLRVVEYDRDAVLDWINANAECTRQMFPIAADHFGLISNDEAIRIHEQTIALRKKRDIASIERAEELSEELFRLALPADMYERMKEIGGGLRMRGVTPWAAMDYQVKSLDEMFTINELLERFEWRNNEIAYRHIYAEGWIRVAVAGRRWYVPAPEMVYPENDGKIIIYIPYALMTGE